MKYSIIIPTLNEEKLLPNLLNQITDKNLKDKFDYEIIVSDGGSKDATVDIALQFVNTVKVHTNGRQQSIGEGRNEGTKYATGDIFIFLNGDIKFDNPVYFFNFVENEFASGDYLAMTCRVKIFPEEEIFADKLYHGFYNNYFKALNILGVGMGRGECQVIKREAFEKVNGFNEEIIAGEDFDLFRRIKKHGKILYADDICVYESPRRFRKLGYFAVTWYWLKNAFSVLTRNKSISTEWEEVR